MEKTVWEQILFMWERNYYMETLWFFCMIVALFIGLKNYRKGKIHLYFIIYILSGLIIFPTILFILATNYMKSWENTIIIESCNTVFSIIEIAVFYNYFNKLLKTKSVLVVMKFCLLTFAILSITFFLKLGNPQLLISDISSFSYLLNTAEFFFLLLPCLVFFYESINIKTIITKSLKETPSFLISSGLFFYIIVSLPLLLIGNTLKSYSQNLFHLMFGLHFLSLSILSLSLSKAFSCKTPLTT